jgi:hypothetical protein
MTWITPYHQDMDFRRPLSFGDKVSIFAEQVSGWQLDIADACINGGLDVMRHSGFAVLHIVLSYFEMIAELKDLKPYGGKGSEGKFNAGVLDVLGRYPSASGSNRDEVLKILYVSARCGLYHEGRIRRRIVLSGEFLEPVVFCSQAQQLGINPHKLVPALKVHLQEYLAALQDPSRTDLRSCFERGFDRMNATDPLVSTTPKNTL